jgi:hypothetical protein
MIKKSVSMALTTLILGAGLTGCTHRLGNLTIASTNNVDGLRTNVTSAQRVKGESCNHAFLIIPWGDFENRLQIATDNAIDNGHATGLKGDTLINTKINVNAWTTIIYSQNCLTVEGDLISLKESMSN